MDKSAIGGHHTSDFNPSTIKIKNSFRRNKKKQENNQSKTLSPTINSDKKTGCNSQQYNIGLMDSMTIPMKVTQKKEVHNMASLLPTPSPRPKEELSFVIDRNKNMQEQIKFKNIKIDDLNRRCEILEMKILAQSPRKNNSSLERPRKDFLELTKCGVLNNKSSQLRAIKEKLEKVSFDHVLRNLKKEKLNQRRQ